MPHTSSGYRSGSGKSVGSLSICQPSTPFDRARRAQMREAAAIFHAAEEKSGPVGQAEWHPR